jgi:hypothetical protein
MALRCSETSAGFLSHIEYPPSPSPSSTLTLLPLGHTGFSSHLPARTLSLNFCTHCSLCWNSFPSDSCMVHFLVPPDCKAPLPAMVFFSQSTQTHTPSSDFMFWLPAFFHSYYYLNIFSMILFGICHFHYNVSSMKRQFYLICLLFYPST